ncbi:hypothetical protein C8Q80DRAFT_65573 [Daedaleopsis nitida]|nr:hypothetical protein C8Q80DRAFT_65573 [Daedaleopsis nitida]
MPRRPRPASRRPPQYAGSPVKAKPATKAAPVKTASATRTNRKHPVSQENSESETTASHSDSEGSFEEGEGSSDAGSSGSEAGEDDLNADAEPDVARVAQWVDEDDLDVGSEEEEESSDEEEGDGARLEADLHSLSFGALRKAQKALAKAHAVNDSDYEDASEGSEPEGQPTSRPGRADKGTEREESSREKREVPKRKHKHAPTEMTSKRPVSRSRFIAEDKPAPRDPRFLHITGEYDAKQFQTQYGFISDLHQDELKTLRENHKRARKLLANSPRDLREEREAEVERLERAVKRAESAVNKDRREKVEMEALSKAAKEEREKQKQGKKAWFMKDADKKDMLLRAKYDALAAAGGRGAVRKAIEKKQKKVNQKEKKKRPYVAGQSPRHGPQLGEGGPSHKRPRPESERGPPRKRPRPS